MGNFLSLNVGQDYRSSSHRLGSDFFGLLLPMSSAYDRAVAYFSSSVFLSSYEAFGAFFGAGRQMRLVCSPTLEPRDVDGFVQGIIERPRVLKDRRSPEELIRSKDRVALVAGLVARGLLAVKIAVGPSDSEPRLYHEKIGLFRDEEGRLLAFSGSANESNAAWSENFERVDVYASWGDQRESHRTRRLRMQFDQLWKNETPGLTVLDLVDAVREGRLLARASDRPEPGATVAVKALPVSGHAEALVPAAGIELYPHQKRALVAWGAAGGRGIFEMATGSGKTITALTLASKLFDGVGPGLAILIIAPFIHLVDQWCESAAPFGLAPIRCAIGREHWYQELASSVHTLNAGRRPVLSIATTAATLQTPDFQNLIGKIERPLLVIGDEAHNYGAPKMAAALPRRAAYRVGLSATPDRWMDDEGTGRVREYFGASVFEYGLREAIQDEVLTPYRYHPILVDLGEDELEEYLDLTRALARYLHGDEDGPLSEAAKWLLLKRARLVASARSKLPRLKELISKHRRDTHILVYCGDGRVEGQDPDETQRQVDEAVRMIGLEVGMTCAKYTAETSPEQRRELLRSFSSGDLQVLVAIRCLDEGVDVPATRVAYLLASSTNPRQFVQRRGRVLRRYPGKYRAEIHDFFVCPPLDALAPGSEEFRVVQRLFGNQIRRAREFADLAENGPVARQELFELTRHLKVVSEWSEL